MADLTSRMRAAAKREGGSEALRLKTGLAPDTFYRLLRGEAPRTTRVIQKLSDAGVKVPRDILAA